MSNKNNFVCPKCNYPNVHSYGRQVYSNGISKQRIYCPNCKRYSALERVRIEG